MKFLTSLKMFTVTAASAATLSAVAAFTFAPAAPNLPQDGPALKPTGYSVLPPTDAAYAGALADLRDDARVTSALGRSLGGVPTVAVNHLADLSGSFTPGYVAPECVAGCAGTVTPTPSPASDSVSGSSAYASPFNLSKNFPLQLVIANKEDKRPDPTVAVARQFGTSSEGRPLTVYTRAGSHNTSRTVMVIGVTHGQENEGIEVTNRLLTAELPADLKLHIIPVLNPDGLAVAQELGVGPLGERGAHTATGTNLNRNFPTNWETGTFFSSRKYYSGTGPASEVETQAFMELAEELQPDFSAWYHAPWAEIDCEVERAPSCVKFAEMVGFEVDFAPRPGTATDWVMSAGLGESFVVEMGPNRLNDDAAYNLHVEAVLALGTP